MLSRIEQSESRFDGCTRVALISLNNDDPLRSVHRQALA